tara:strand:+ start:85 stop:444 length:360 start_codon:yes stop_codon:yes gene_type:complete
MNEVFVYGTLKRNEGNNDLLGDSKYLGKYETEPRWGLVNLGAFPGMVPSNKAVKGEVFLVDDDTMEVIDALEGVDYGLYRRSRIYIYCPTSGSKREVWTYIYGGIVMTNNSDTTAEWVK